MKRAIYLIAVLIVLVTVVCIGNAQAEEKPDKLTTIPVSPAEDLMREHGVLSRVLLIYEEIIRRLDNNEAFPPEALAKSTDIVRNFIQNYHEKLEEKYLFSRFRKANKFVELTKVLDRQHEAGRKVVDDIMIQEKLQNTGDKKSLVESLRSFIRMYRPHKAREDTILFPAFHSIVSPEEYKELGEEFENEEQRLFGEGGFENIVSHVEGIEKALGIYELSQFTPSKYKDLPTWEERKKQNQGR
jgi:hemerythrin-like domain-containing protein